MKLLLFVASFFLITLFSCSHEYENKQQLLLSTYVLSPGKLFIEKLDIGKGRYQKIDSLQLNTGSFEKSFNIDDSSKTIYRIRISNTGIIIPFVFDKDDIKLVVDYARPKDYTFIHSPDNQSFKVFLNLQDSISKIIAQLNKAGSSKNSTEQLYKQLFDNYKAYADTVSNPLLFVQVYDKINFNEHLSQQKKYLETALQKFKQHKAIAVLYNRVVNFEKIQNTEFNVGQLIPPLQLTDANGKLFSTADFKGQLYFINIWTTWCNSCMPYFATLNDVLNKKNKQTVTVLNIAIDREKADWQQMIARQNPSFVQVIDEDMWEGKVASTLCMDSIPFNFVVSKNGVILAKALKPNQVADTLIKYLNQ